jgi:hypothetical protein
LHLALQIPAGYGSEFASACRLPGVDKNGFIDAAVFVAAAKEAGRGKVDAVFLADRGDHRGRPGYEPAEVRPRAGGPAGPDGP